jgi:uncharacterized membrane protein
MGIILVVIVIWLIIEYRDQGPRISDRTRTSPMDILKERYARGEISREDYMEASRLIR